MSLLCHKLYFWPLDTILFLLLILLLAVEVLNSSRRFDVMGTTELIDGEAPAADEAIVIVDYLLLVIVIENPPVTVVGDNLGIPDSVIVFYFFRGMSSKVPDHLRFYCSFCWIGGYRNLFISGQVLSWDLLRGARE